MSGMRGDGRTGERVGLRDVLRTRAEDLKLLMHGRRSHLNWRWTVPRRFELVRDGCLLRHPDPRQGSGGSVFSASLGLTGLTGWLD